MRILTLFFAMVFYIELNYPLHTQHLLPDERIVATFPIKSPTLHISFKYLLFSTCTKLYQISNFINSYNSVDFIALSREKPQYKLCCMLPHKQYSDRLAGNSLITAGCTAKHYYYIFPFHYYLYTNI